MRVSSRLIYHLTPASVLLRSCTDGRYTPPGLAREGFVHCCEKDSVVPIAEDYFREVTEPLLVLAIDLDRLRSETRFEAPAPIAGGGTAHLEGAPKLFPHIYGPIDLEAVRGVGVVGGVAGERSWPREFLEVERFL